MPPLMTSQFKPRQRHSTPARAPFPLPEGLRRQFDFATKSLAERFKGVTTDGHVVPDLFAIRKTGVPTAPILEAAQAYVASLNADQRARTCFELQASEWRQWS